MNGLRKVKPHRVVRVQGLVGALEHHLQVPEELCVAPRQVARQRNVEHGDGPLIRSIQTDNRSRKGALAAARLAYQTEGASRNYGQIDTIDRPHLAGWSPPDDV